MTRTNQERPTTTTIAPLDPKIAHRVAQISDLIVEIQPLIRDLSVVPAKHVRTVRVRRSFSHGPTVSLVRIGDSPVRSREQVGMDDQGTLWDFNDQCRLRVCNLTEMDFRAISILHCNLIMLKVNLTRP